MNIKTIILSTTSILLASCGSQTTQVKSELPSIQPQKKQAKSYDYLLTVKLKSTDTKATLEKTYNGVVLSFAPEFNEALIGLNTQQVQQLQLNMSAASHGPVLSQLNQTQVTLERNKNTFRALNNQMTKNGIISFWNDGIISFWNDGIISFWNDGIISFWNDGQQNMVSENKDVWDQIGLEGAHEDAKNKGAGVKIAIIDSGIDLKHVAFQGALAPVNEHWDFVSQDGVPQEEGRQGYGAYGHGTAVAGIALQIAPKAKILPLRVLNADGGGDAAHIAQAINRARVLGADIINLSLGSTTRSYAVQQAIHYATQSGVFVVASSGNTGDDKVTYPARDMFYATSAGLRSISVGSVNTRGEKSSFSTYGNQSYKVELMAPGERIYSPFPNNKMFPWSGTSMAAPMATGGLALALGERKTTSYKNYTYHMIQKAQNIKDLKANEKFANFIGNQIDLEEFLDDVHTY